MDNSSWTTTTTIEPIAERTIKIIDDISFHTDHVEPFTIDIKEGKIAHSDLSTYICVFEDVVAETTGLENYTAWGIMVNAHVLDRVLSCFASYHSWHAFCVVSSVNVCIVLGHSYNHWVFEHRRLSGEVGLIEFDSWVVVFSNYKIFEDHMSCLFS